MVVGPYDTIDIGNGVTADYYLLRYDKDGNLLSKQTEQHLKESLTDITDVFLFSHGWNNTFDDANKNYREFIDGYIAQGAKFGQPRPAGYKPVLIGIIWPSTSFLFPWEKGPLIAGSSASVDEEMLRLILDELPPQEQAEFTELVDGRSSLGREEARRGAEILIDNLRSEPDPDDHAAPPPIDDVLDTVQLLEGDDAGPREWEPEGGGDDLRTAGGFALDPRGLLRLGTVWLMKARAGKVGVNGVGPLVRHILDQNAARLHLIGHSFGARVVLSALAAGPAQQRPARSMLLLQPAVNRWCFAPKVIGMDQPGGYYTDLDRVELAILSTFSKYDIPLHDVFQFAIHTVGEIDIAALSDEDRYGALGGYGPAGLDKLSSIQSAIAPGAGSYDLGTQVVAVDGSVDLDGEHAIGGHSDINKPITWWALHCLTAAP